MSSPGEFGDPGIPVDAVVDLNSFSLALVRGGARVASYDPRFHPGGYVILDRRGLGKLMGQELGDKLHDMIRDQVGDGVRILPMEVLVVRDGEAAPLRCGVKVVLETEKVLF